MEDKIKSLDFYGEKMGKNEKNLELFLQRYSI